MYSIVGVQKSPGMIKGKLCRLLETFSVEGSRRVLKGAHLSRRKFIYRRYTFMGELDKSKALIEVPRSSLGIGGTSLGKNH